jgi:hypothetical protein
LDTQLDVVRAGDTIQLRHGEDLIARAQAATSQITALPAPDIQAARQRQAAFAGYRHHVFPGCFVCGVDREAGDGLLIHAGPGPTPDQSSDEVTGHVACAWTPHQSLCDGDGRLPEHFAWAALDCPGGWSFLSYGTQAALLGEFTAEILSPLECGIEYIVAGWELARDGRKRHTGSAIYDAGGKPLAKALATWIVIST